MQIVTVAIGCVLVAIGVLLPATAQADTPITSFTAVPSTTQAGGHPDVEVAFSVANRVVQNRHSACNCEDAKNATVHLPAGVIGNPHATPQCTLSQFGSNTCPVDSQVGIAHVQISNAGELFFISAVYNIVPPPEEAGLLGFKVYGFETPAYTLISARTGGDYGLDVKSNSIPHWSFPLQAIQQVLWGVPAEAIHNPLRINLHDTPGNGPAYFAELCDADGALSTDNPSSVVFPCGRGGLPPPLASSSPLTPFFQNPTNCESSSLESSLEVLSYDTGETFAHSPWPRTTGCDQLSFNPSLYAQPTTTATDSASGIDVDLKVPQQLSPTVPSPTELRATTVTLPVGFSINPNASDGKTSCSDTAARFGTEEEARCPEFSKVGSLTIESSALPGPLPGFVYLGEPQPGNRYRIFLVANGFATHVKLAGSVIADPKSGQLTISFPELPETPLTAFNMHFFGSERGLLATPNQCGTYPVTSTFTPWDEALASQTSTQFFSLETGPGGAPCPGSIRPFSPHFQAVSLSHTAGAHSPFAFELTRNDGDQNLAGLTVRTPPGLSATLNGVSYCPSTALTAAAEPSYSGLQEEENPSCPASSQIGTAQIGAGAGSHPVYVSGKVYLAGPYKGAPLSLAVITPAISGPYDLGNVVTRAALHVDPTTAQITAVSDPIPHILEGIPLRLRSIRVELNRPNFTLNPTDCDPFAVDATIDGEEGAQVSLTEHFQVANCGTLPFAPKLSAKVSGSTKRAGNPSLHTALAYAGHEANIKSAVVTLPPTEIIDNAHLSNPCTKVTFAEGTTPGERCPPSTMIGYAKAATPILEKPLEGPVYLRSAGTESKSGLPNLVAALNGQIDIDLVGQIDTAKDGGLRTTFETVPDAPVSNFTLTLDGGAKGLIQNSASLCAHPLHLGATIAAQNGRSANQNPVLQTPCGKGSKQAKRHHSRRAAGRKGWR